MAEEENRDAVLLLLAILIVDRRVLNMQRFNFLFGCAATLILASTAWSSIGLAFMDETFEAGSSSRWSVAVFVIGVLIVVYAAVIVLAGIYGLVQRNVWKAPAASFLFIAMWWLVPAPLAFYRGELAEAGTVSSATDEALDLSQAGKFEDALAVLAGLGTEEGNSLQARTAAITIHMNAIRSTMQEVLRYYDSGGEPLLAAARKAESHRSRLIEQLASVRRLHGNLSAVQLFLADVNAAVLGDCGGARIGYRATLLNGDGLSIEKARALPRLSCLCGTGCADAGFLASQDAEDVPWSTGVRRNLDLVEIQLAAMTRGKVWRSGRPMDPAEVLGTSEDSNVLNKSYACSCDKVAEVWTAISDILASDKNR